MLERPVAGRQAGRPPSRANASTKDAYSLKVRLCGEAVHGRCGSPRQLLGSEDLDERRVPIVLVQHRRANIDEEVQAMGVCEHPVLAMWTVELPVSTMQAADHRLALGDGKTIAWHSNGQRVCTRAQLLTARAMTRHRQQWRGTYSETYPAAQAAAFPRRVNRPPQYGHGCQSPQIR
jgi:hypothetical protein